MCYLPDVVCAHGELVVLALAISGIYAGKHLAAQIAAAEATPATPAVNTPAGVPGGGQ